MAKASVREISRRTGYSPATVSNALNHKRGVSKET
ncbi:MAG: LacI family DNA-binding transcriptional regulator, partial [Atopobiaceae bacterium]|nr:LacI family DNA-binding transcriptional regulator [Atopobiaceae bacterium]